MITQLNPRNLGARYARYERTADGGPIRNGLLIALKAVAPHAAPARSIASAAAASAAAAAAARPRPDAPPGPPRFTSTFACSPYDPHHQPDHSRDDRDDNNTHQDARHNTPPSQQVPPLSALLPGSFRAPTPIGTSSWVLFLVGYRSRRVLVSCCTSPQFAGQSAVSFASTCAGRASADHGRKVDHPPTDTLPQRGQSRPQPSVGRPSSLPRAWRRAHCVQVPQVRDNGVRATTQPPRDTRRACDCADLERAGLTPKTPACHRQTRRRPSGAH